MAVRGGTNCGSEEWWECGTSCGSVAPVMAVRCGTSCGSEGRWEYMAPVVAVRRRTSCSSEGSRSVVREDDGSESVSGSAGGGIEGSSGGEGNGGGEEG